MKHIANKDESEKDPEINESIDQHKQRNTMNQFNFTGKIKRFLIGFMILGFVCLLITFFTDDPLHTRFWTNYLHNTLFFGGIGFLSLFILAAFITAYAGWYVNFKRVFEAFSMFILPALLLMVPIIVGLWGGWHHLYHWADAESVAQDPILQGKSAFLNKWWYTLGTIIIVSVWYFLFAKPLRRLSLKEGREGTTEFKIHKKIKIYAAAFLPVAGFTSAALVWQWLMSIDAHWYSTLFAWYTTISWFVAAICMVLLVLHYLKSKGYYEEVTKEHIHDLGKYVFAFSIFWTYLWFSQYMLIWYGNIGEETIYFQTRLEEYPTLFYGNLLINFALPFFVLMRNDTKRKAGTIVFAAAAVLFGHWLDFFLMIKPGALHTAHEILLHHGAHGSETSGAHEAVEHASGFVAGFTAPGLLEIGTFLGFAALFLYLAFNQLAKAPLVPRRDPYLKESLHHHV